MISNKSLLLVLIIITISFIKSYSKDEILNIPPPKPTLSASSSLVCTQGSNSILTVGNCTGSVNWNVVGGTFSNGSQILSTYSARIYIYDLNQYFVSCTLNGETSINSDTIQVDYRRIKIVSDDNFLCTGGNKQLTAELSITSNISSFNWYFNSTLDNTQTTSTYNASTIGNVFARVNYTDGCIIQSLNFTIISSGTLANPNIVGLKTNSNTGVAQKVFDKRFGGTQSETVSDIIPLSNKNILMGGTIMNGVSGDITQTYRGQFDYWLVKTDSIGNKIWDKRFGGPSQNKLSQIEETANGDILAFGISNSSIGWDKTVDVIIDPSIGPIEDIWVVKANSDGIKLWDKKYGGDDYDDVSDIVKLPNDYFIMAGRTRSGISGTVSQTSKGGNDFWVCKIDANGTKIWDKRFGGSGNDNCVKILKTQDGGFILAGSSESPISGDKTQSTPGYADVWVIKIDSNGTKIWDRSIYNTNNTLIFSFSAAHLDYNNNIFIAGNTPFIGETQITKLSASGTTVWTKKYQGLNSPKGIIPNEKGILIYGDQNTSISSLFSSSISGNADGYIIQLDSLGNKVWDKLLGGSNSDYLSSHINLGQNSIILAGFSNSNISGLKSQPTRGLEDLWMVKVNLNESLTAPFGVSTGQTIELVANNCPGQVSWTGDIIANGPLVSVTPTPPASYTATCTAYGCSTSTTIPVLTTCSENFTFLVKNTNGQVLSDPKICVENASFILETINCAGSVTWSTAQTGASITVSPTVSTEYTATCSGTSCAPVTVKKQITLFTSPTITFTGNTTFCFGDSISLVTNILGSGYQYEWHKNLSAISPSETGLSLKVKTSGSYNVKASKSGCSAFATSPVIITALSLPNAPTFSSSEVFTCAGIPTPISAQGCSGTINWPGNEIHYDQSVNIYVYLNYYTPVKYIKANCTVNGCKSADNTVKVSLGSVTLGNNSRYVCNGESTTITSSTLNNAPISWYKNNVLLAGQSNSTLQTAEKGNYKSVVTISNSCSYSSNIVEVIKVDTILSPILSQVDTPNINQRELLKVWDKTFGGNNISYGQKILKTQDGNFIIIGSSEVNSNGNISSTNKGLLDILVLKIDSLGNKIWEKQFGTSWFDQGISAEETSDGNLLILGTTATLNDGDKTELSLGGRDFWLIKIDNLGNKIWDKVYGGEGEDDNPTLLKTTDNNYIIAGRQRTTLGSAIITNYRAIKINDSGTIIWTKSFDSGGTDYFMDAINTLDGGYIFAGNSQNPVPGFDRTGVSQGLADIWIIKTDKNGNKLWDKSYGGSGSEFDIRIFQAPDSSFIIGSSTTSGISGNKTKPNYNTNSTSDIWIFKTDSLGVFLWDKNYGGSDNDYLVDFKLLDADNIFIASTSTSPLSNDITTPPFGTPSHNNADIIFMQYDLNTNISISQKRIGGSDSDYLASLFWNNGSFYFAGNSSSEKNEGKHANKYSTVSDIWLGKLLLTKPLYNNSTVNILPGQSVNLFTKDCSGSILWSDNSTGNAISVSPSVNTTYTANCNIGNCTVSSTVTVKVISCGQLATLTAIDNILTGTSANPVIYRAFNKISATNEIGSLIQNASGKYLAGNSIEMSPGFKVEAGSVFQANISSDPCNQP